MIECVIVLALLSLLIATDPEPGQRPSVELIQRTAGRLPSARFIGRLNGGRQIYQLTDPSRNWVFSAAKGHPRPMNTPKTVLLGCLCVGALFASGFVTQARRAAGRMMAPRAPAAAVDPVLTTAVARAQAAAVLSAQPGAAALLQLQP